MHRHVARTGLFAVVVVLLGASSAHAQWARSSQSAGQMRFRLGIFEPAATSDGWDGVFDGFTGSPTDLQDMVFGVDFLWYTGRNHGVLFGSSFYDGATTSAYSEWLADDGSEIRHTTDLQIADLTAAFVYRFGDGGIRPYLGAGGGILWYSLTEVGDFIDFGSPGNPIFHARYRTSATAFEAFALAGFDIAISPRWQFFIEGRYRHASDTLGDAYSGFGDLDLSGYDVSGGFGLTF